MSKTTQESQSSQHNATPWNATDAQKESPSTDVVRALSTLAFGLFPAKLMRRDQRRTPHLSTVDYSSHEVKATSSTQPSAKLHSNAEPPTSSSTDKSDGSMLLQDDIAASCVNVVADEDLLQQDFIRNVMVRSFRCFYGSDDAITSDEDNEVSFSPRTLRSRRIISSHDSTGCTRQPTCELVQRLEQTIAGQRLETKQKEDFMLCGDELKGYRSPVSRQPSRNARKPFPWMSMHTLTRDLLLPSNFSSSSKHSSSVHVSTDDSFASYVPRRLRFLHTRLYWGDLMDQVPGTGEVHRILASRLAATLRPRRRDEGSICCVRCVRLANRTTVTPPRPHPLSLAPFPTAHQPANASQRGLYRRVPLIAKSISHFYDVLDVIAEGKILNLHEASSPEGVDPMQGDLESKDHVPPCQQFSLEPDGKAKADVVGMLRRFWKSLEDPSSTTRLHSHELTILNSHVLVLAAKCKFTGRCVAMKRTPLNPRLWAALHLGKESIQDVIPGWTSLLLALQLSNVADGIVPTGWPATGYATTLEVIISELEPAVYQVVEHIPKRWADFDGMIADDHAPTLFDRLFANGVSIAPQDVAELMKQVLSALVHLRDPLKLAPTLEPMSHCHLSPRFSPLLAPGTCISHRDIKPHNLVCLQKEQKQAESANSSWSSTQLVLVDFDDVQMFELAFDEPNFHRVAGSPIFVAPEVLHPRRRRFLASDDSSDMWSLGALLFHMTSRAKLNRAGQPFRFCMGPNAAGIRKSRRTDRHTPLSTNGARRQRSRSASCPPPPPCSIHALVRERLVQRSEDATATCTLSPHEAELLRSRLALDSAARRFHLMPTRQGCTPSAANAPEAGSIRSLCNCPDHPIHYTNQHSAILPRIPNGPEDDPLCLDPSDLERDLLDLMRTLLQHNPLLRPKPEEALRHVSLHLPAISPATQTFRRASELVEVTPGIRHLISDRMCTFRRLLMTLRQQTKANNQPKVPFTLQFSHKTGSRSRKSLLALLALTAFIPSASTSLASRIHRILPDILKVPEAHALFQTSVEQNHDYRDMWHCISMKQLAKSGRKGFRKLKKCLQQSKLAFSSSLAQLIHATLQELRSMQSTQRSVRQALYRHYASVVGPERAVDSTKRTSPAEASGLLVIAPGLTVDLRDWSTHTSDRMLERQLRELKQLGLSYLVRLVLIPAPRINKIQSEAGPRYARTYTRARLYSATPTHCIPNNPFFINHAGELMSTVGDEASVWLELGAPLPWFDPGTMCGLLDIPLLLSIEQVSTLLASQCLHALKDASIKEDTIRTFKLAVEAYSRLRFVALGYTFQTLVPSLFQVEEDLLTPAPGSSADGVDASKATSFSSYRHATSLSHQPQATLLGLTPSSSLESLPEATKSNNEGSQPLDYGSIRSNGVILQISPLIPAIRMRLQQQRLQKAEGRISRRGRQDASTCTTPRVEESLPSMPTGECKYTERTFDPSYWDLLESFPQFGAIPVGKMCKDQTSTQAFTDNVVNKPSTKKRHPPKKKGIHGGMMNSIDPDSDLDPILDHELED